jgi:hypothetical protein
MSDSATANFLSEEVLEFDALAIGVVDGHSVIDTGDGNSITVRNVAALSPDDFKFFAEPEPWDLALIPTLTASDFLM